MNDDNCIINMCTINTHLCTYIFYYLSAGKCITYLYVMAYTSDIRNAGADKDHKIKLQAKGIGIVKSLPNLPGDDYLQNKGDLWKLHLKYFFGFTTCITINDIQQIAILQGSNDGWNIKSIVTFAVVNQNEWEMTSADFDVFQWIDGDSDTAHKEFVLSLHISTGRCIRFLYVVAYTTGVKNAGADSSHRIELQAKGVTKAKVLPNLPGDDYSKSKGDLWTLSIKDYFGLHGCITKDDIQGIALLSGSNDGWHIDSVVTYVAVHQRIWELSSVDLDANRWVDGDSSHTYKRFNLNLVI